MAAVACNYAESWLRLSGLPQSPPFLVNPDTKAECQVPFVSYYSWTTFVNHMATVGI